MHLVRRSGILLLVGLAFTTHVDRLFGASSAAPTPPRPRIVGISHAAFFVSDMAKARSFYEGFLGFASPFSIPRKNPDEHLVWIKINDRQSVELFPGSEVAPDADRPNMQPRSTISKDPAMATSTETAILAGGCFWGVQDLLRRYPGVISTRVGYSGGDVPNATYRNHGTHAEAIEIVFDPATISFRRLLEFFFQIHDPTTLNRQGNDIGLSYRSAIFYPSEAQKETALETIADVDASGLWPGKVVTEVTPAGDFWQAEPEHQDYLLHYPTGYSCHSVRPDWKLPQRVKA